MSRAPRRKASPVRLAILDAIEQYGEVTVSQVIDIVGCTEGTGRNHLSDLDRQNIVVRSYRDQKYFYRLRGTAEKRPKEETHAGTGTKVAPATRPPFKPLTRALHGPACGIGRPWHPGSVSGEGWLR